MSGIIWPENHERLVTEESSANTPTSAGPDRETDALRRARSTTPAISSPCASGSSHTVNELANGTRKTP
jgi:hypothetical protein